MGPTQCARTRRYRATMRGKYTMHRHNANKRGVPFELTFGQWKIIWVMSGHWSERGNRPWQYVMSRVGDAGAYTWGNVFIQTNRENMNDCGWPKPLPPVERLAVEASIAL